jgi:hypothetical protein
VQPVPRYLRQAQKKPPPVPFPTLLRTRSKGWVPHARVLDPTTGWACKHRSNNNFGSQRVLHRFVKSDRRVTNTAEVKIILPRGNDFASRPLIITVAIIKSRITPDRSRTCNLWLRRPSLYPVELRVPDFCNIGNSIRPVNRRIVRLLLPSTSQKPSVFLGFCHEWEARRHPCQGIHYRRICRENPL